MNRDRNEHVLICREDGAVAVIVGVALLMLVSFAALAIDIGHLYVVKNELQNAADAAALAGARVLYNDDGSMVNAHSNQTAYDTAISNTSENVPVDVHGLQGGDVERGHWSFSTGTFTSNSSTDPVDLADVSTAELDANPAFINAVKVITRREDTPAASFLAGIFGKDEFVLSAEAVAYIGFAGSLDPGEADMPIAICRDSLLMTGKYTCNMGRMINSGSNIQTSETAGWTNYAQQREAGDPDPCLGGTNASEVNKVIDPPGPGKCFGENLDPILLGKKMASLGGQVESVMSTLRDCWEEAADTDNDGHPDSPWNLTLPVIECPANNVDVCETVVGAVNVNVVWISGKGESACDFHPPYFDEVNNVWVEENLPPMKMGDWSCAYQPPTTDQEMQECWNSFVHHFNLQNVDGSTAPCAKKSLYFQPDCTPHEPTGRAGGENFGVLSKYPVLVQ